MANIVSETHAGRCPVGAPEPGSNIEGCVALGVFFKGTVSEGWYFGSVKEQQGTNCVVKYGTTIEKTSIETLIERHHDEQEFILPAEFWAKALADMETMRNEWRHTVEHGPLPESPRIPRPLSEQATSHARRKERKQQQKQQRSSSGSSGGGGGTPHDASPLPPLPRLTDLPDGIPTWNDFQRQKIFKGHKNSEVAIRWQEYQAAGRKGVGDEAVAAWEAAEARRAAQSKQRAQAAASFSKGTAAGRSSGGGSGGKGSNKVDLREQKWVEKMVKVAQKANQANMQAKFVALYRQMKADLQMASADSSEESSDDDSQKCKRCGREFDTVRGLLNHKRVCTADGESDDAELDPPDDIDSALSLEEVRSLIVSGELLDREIEVWWDGDSTWFPGRQLLLKPLCRCATLPLLK